MASTFISMIRSITLKGGLWLQTWGGLTHRDLQRNGRTSLLNVQVFALTHSSSCTMKEKRCGLFERMVSVFLLHNSGPLAIISTSLEEGVNSFIVDWALSPWNSVTTSEGQWIFTGIAPAHPSKPTTRRPVGVEVAPSPALSTGWSSIIQEEQQAEPGPIPGGPIVHGVPGRKPVILVFNKWDLSGKQPFVAMVGATHSPVPSRYSQYNDGTQEFFFRCRTVI